MPAGTRVRANNAYGTTTDNPLTAGATTMNSAALTTLPGVAVGQHAIIVLDPKRVNGQPEIVIVTVHTGLSTSATITRAAYGTIARSHPSGTAWAHVAVDEDYTEILTSTTRPLDPYEGQTIYEIDTKSFRQYNGTGWNSSPPVGTLLPYLGSSAPDGYLMANGDAVSRTGVTADLFGVIGTTYGVGDGSTTYNLPNLNGRVPVGRDASQTEFDALGKIGGAKTVTLTQAQLAVHTHGVTDPTHNHGQTAHGHGNTAHGHGNDAHGHPADDNDAGGHTHDSTNGVSNVVQAAAGPFNVNGAGTNWVTFDSGHVFRTSNDGTHNHNITVSAVGINIHGQTIGIHGANANIQAAGSGITINSAGSNEAHNNLQPYITVNYIVKI